MKHCSYISPCKISLLAGTVLFILCFGVQQAGATFVINFTQNANNTVTAAGSGSLNITDLTIAATAVSAYAALDSDFGTGGGGTPGVVLQVGSALPTASSTEDLSGIFGPAAIGSDTGYYLAKSGSGNMVGVDMYLGVNELIAPNGYTSGTALTDTATWGAAGVSSASFASLGLTAGTSFEYDWGTGADKDCLIVNVGGGGSSTCSYSSLPVTPTAPEPTSVSLLCGGGLALAAFGLRSRFARG